MGVFAWYSNAACHEAVAQCCLRAYGQQHMLIPDMFLMSVSQQFDSCVGSDSRPLVWHLKITADSFQ